MEITDVHATLLHIPWDRQLDARSHPKPIIEVVAVRVETNEGLEGNGYTYTDGYGGHAVAALAATDIRELSLGRDPLRVEPLVEELYWKLRKVGYGGLVSLAVAAVEFALWDVASKAAGRPLVDLFGGRYRDRMPVYSSAIGSRMLPVEEQIERARELLHDFVGVKIQVGRPDPRDDIERVRAVREALGAGAKIIVDANTLWDADRTIKVGRAIEPFDIYYMEEPIPPYDVEGHARIRRMLATPLATGEGMFDYRECTELVQRRIVSFIQPNVCRIGGIGRWRRVAGVAEAYNTKVAPHFMAELHVQLLCAIPNAEIVEYVPWLVQNLKEPPLVKEGFIYPRAKPGLGMEFSDEAIARFRVE